MTATTKQTVRFFDEADRFAEIAHQIVSGEIPPQSEYADGSAFSPAAKGPVKTFTARFREGDDRNFRQHWTERLKDEAAVSEYAPIGLPADSGTVPSFHERFRETDSGAAEPASPSFHQLFASTSTKE
jgi:hypothetical protein